MEVVFIRVKGLSVIHHINIILICMNWTLEIVNWTPLIVPMHIGHAPVLILEVADEGHPHQVFVP